MSVKTWAIQLYGFLVKAALQRWRTPIGTVVELLLPCVFTLLLSLAYWTTESEDLPATMYDGPSAILFNFSSIVNSMKAFCTTPGSSLSTSWSTCSSDPSEYECISIVGNGNDLCLRNEKAATLGGLLFSQYYLSGPTALYPMDIYLTISAFVTDTSNKLNPTFFGRGGQASLSHYGKLLVASESTSLGEAFMDFCRKQSGMCGEVLYSSLFSKMGDAEDYALNHDNTVWAIVYLPEDILSATTQAEYTISMNYTATPWTFTNSRTSTFFRGDTGSSSSPGYQLYYNSGFMTLQTFVQEFFLQRNVENGVPVTGGAVYKSIKPFVGVNNYLGTWGSAVIPMPSPPQYSNAFMDTWAYYVPLVAMFAALFPIARVTGLIVDEKPEGIREAMLIMGLHPTCLFAGWYASSLVVDLVASLLAAMVLKIGFLHYVSYGVLLALYFSFMQQNTALTLLISSLFTNPRVASWCAAFVIFLCAIPFYSFPENMSDGSKIGVALVPCVGYTEAFSILTEYATFGQDFRWEDAHSGKFCVAVAIGMMWASFVVMMLLAYYLDRVGPGRVGCRPSYYFFLEPLLALCRTKAEPPMLRMGVNTSPDMDGDGVCEAAKLLEHNGEVVDPCDSSVAAVAYQLRKTHNCGGFFGFWYTFFTGVFRDGDRVESLRGVSFAMKTGEVSVLLGPNGAGKSTLMGVVTGMVRATDGDVYVRGRNLTSELDECRQNIGYCPQSDTVWSWMTVEEHLTFYARLKGADSVVVQPHVDEAIELVGLTEKRDCRAGCLSGGQRRRLCVAIALVGGSSVLLLDEPTAGMDMKGRRTVYDALNRARAERSVLISTHLLDEADRIGDRILLMNEGQLCGEGSAMFLKSRMSVGYIVTCVLDNDMDAGEEDRAVSSLIDFVREKGYEGHRCPHSGEIQAIPPTCKLLGVERRGREVRFRFPMSLLSTSGRQLMTSIEEQRKKLSVRSVGLSLTTLEDVFMTATQGSPLMSEEAVADQTGGNPLKGTGDDSLKVTVVRDVSGMDDMYESESSFAVFSRHFRALFLKRVHFAKRDMRLLFFQVLIPVVFLLLSLMADFVRAPNQPSLLLDMSMYGESATSEVLYSCGNTPGVTPNAFALSADIPASAFGTNYTPLYVTPVVGTSNGTLTLSKQLMSEVWTHTESRYVALSPSNFLIQSGPPTYGSGVLHNASAAHSAPQAIDSLYALANHQLFGSNVPQIITRNKPMHLGAFEDELVSANKQVLVGIFILLPFIFIPANTISYIVREKVCGARHLQWLSGANAAAYWISSFVFDALCFIGTTVLAFCILAIFRRTEYVGKDQLGPSAVLFLFFGLSSIPFSYVLSFFFKSPFAAQNTVLIINFVFGFLWVLVESMVYNGAPNFVRVVTYIVRTFPSVAFSEGMFVLSGQELALLMMPQLTRPNMFALLHFDGSGHSVFKGGIGTGLIYMSCTFVVSIVLLVVLEYVRVQRLSGSVAPCGSKDVDEEAAVAAQMDESVMAEEFRVCADAAGPSTDCIATQHLRKRYSGASRAAVSNLSLGVHQGEILGLLGLNGAGKTTAVGMLAGEVVPSGGDAFVNHVSINKPESRSFVGYCPQFDALLDNLSVTEHLWLYARLRGMREEVICDEVEMLTEELGLYPHRLQTAAALSGGNRRRLSLAIALVGRTTSVLLDEPTAGMDAIARAQTCAMVKRLTQDKSVVLTTHLLDEVDALADRVAVISRGDLRCVGTPQELKGRFTKDAEFTVRVLFPHTVSLVCEDQGVVERVRAYVLSTAGHTPNGEEPSCDVDELGVCSMSLKVRSSICDLCGAVSSLSEGGVEGIPRPTYVSLSQPTLEDILVQE